MIRFTVHVAPSRHKRKAHAELRRQVADAIKRAAPAGVPRRIYKLDVVMYGAWYNKDGTPRNRRNADSVLIPLLDAIQAATGLDDAWFDRQGSWRVVQADSENVVVTLS